jgi:hypothetical protein
VEIFVYGVGIKKQHIRIPPPISVHFEHKIAYGGGSGDSGGIFFLS